MNLTSIDEFLLSSLQEDLGRGDLFGQIQGFCNAESKKAHILARQEGIFSGRVYLERLAKLQNLKCECLKNDGEAFGKNEVIVYLSGEFIRLLQTERVALNILAHSSGIATLTNKYIKAMGESKSILLDTRKTRPLLRMLEKYSVQNGGGHNHRFGLDSMLMLKDTHLAGIKNIKEFVESARKALPLGVNIEIETSNLDEFKIALESGVDVIMCDNWQLDSIRQALNLRDSIAKHIKIELSGNISLDTISSYAKLNADYISCGSLIHQATWIDMSMKML